jgi:hypothetical protein
VIVVINFNQRAMKLISFYKDKQSGEVVTEEEMLDLVDKDDNLDSFYFIGDFKTEKEAINHLNSGE